MFKRKSFWLKSNYEFKFIHFILGFISLIVIAIVFEYIYNSYYPNNFTSDINVMTQLPPDVKKVEDLIHSTSVRDATIGAYLLRDVINTPPKIPSQIRIPILVYHYVEYVKDQGDKIRISLNIPPVIFENQIKTLKEAGYTFLTPKQIPEILAGKINIPAKPVILSFDDGYKDFYTDAFPILKKYKVNAVEYVVLGFLDKPNNLSRAQLKEITGSGLIEIGAHTVNHTYLKELSQKRLKYEVEQSKIGLEKEIKMPVISFAYPYGAFDLNVISEVKNAGFKTAVTEIAGNEIDQNNLFYLFRLRPGRRSGQTLIDFLIQPPLHLQ